MAFSIFTGCSSSDGGDTTVTKTKNVTVSFPTFDLSGNNVTEINLTPSFFPTGGWGDFSASDIIFTITDNKGNGNSSFPSGKVKLTDVNTLYSQVNWPWTPPLFTVTFYYKTVDNNNKLGEYKVFICDIGNKGYFTHVIEDNGNNTYDGIAPGNDTLVVGSLFPTTPLTLTLSKEVSE
jgi:hypothetical protein